MEKIIVNGRCRLIETIKNGNNQFVDAMLRLFSENDEDVFGILQTFIKCGFITTSCSCGHNNDDWYDPIYFAVYVNESNVCKVLNIIKLLQGRLPKKDLPLMRFSFNYNAEYGEIMEDAGNAGELNCNIEEKADNEKQKFVEYMFGVQIDLYEQGEKRQKTLELVRESIIRACEMSEGDCVGEIALNYNAIYLINRFIHYSNPQTNWLNISFCAESLSYKFDLIFKKNECDNGVVEKCIEYKDSQAFRDFEFLLNY